MQHQQRPSTLLVVAFLAGNLALSLLPVTARAELPPTKSSTLPKVVDAVIKKHCVACHGPNEQSGSVRLDTLDPDVVKGVNAEDWHDVLNMLNRGEMPPSDRPALPDDERRTFVRWITSELERAKQVKKNSGGQTTIRRLTRYEYNNTMADLLGIEWDYAENLPPDSKSEDGFENNGQSQGISPIQLEYYLKAARLGLSKAIVTGERPEVVKKVISKSQGPGRRSAYTPHKNGQVLPGQAFIGKTLEFPREGVVQITVTVDSIEVPVGQGYPQMLLRVGHRADTISPEAPFAVADVIPQDDGTEVELQFTGRIESMPLPGHNPKFPGVLVSVANSYDPGPDYQQLKRQHEAAKRRLKQYENAKAKAKKQGKPEPKKPVIEEINLPAMPSYVVKSIEFEGPILDSWPPTHHTQILFERPAEMDESSYAQEVIRRFIDRAFRRPATDKDVATIFDYYESIRRQMPTFESAIRESLAMVLISPEFLYLVEPATEPEELDRLTNHEVATRLSYFLWSTMPDAELRDAADKGVLDVPRELEAQVRRMLRDERAGAFAQNFTSQWLGLSGVDRVAVNPQYYPAFDNKLKADMKQETVQFFGEILRRDLSALNLIDSNFVMVNRPLARHYDLPEPKGQAFERVPLEGQHHRGGLLTQASILLMNSNGEDSHPIRRAVWLRDRLLDDPPAPPPPDVPDLDADSADTVGLSLKQQLELHRQKASCADCHRSIDPWGIPMEHFDAVGQWRDQVTLRVNNKTVESPVVSDAQLPGGQRVSNMSELKTVLKSDLNDRFARGLVRYMFAYSLGRSLDYTDSDEVDDMTKRFVASGYQLDELIVAITSSDAFTTK